MTRIHTAFSEIVDYFKEETGQRVCGEDDLGCLESRASELKKMIVDRFAKHSDSVLYSL